MKDTNAIQRKIKNLFEEYEGIRKKAEGEKRSMNANDIKKRTELKAEIDDLVAAVESIEAEAELRSKLFADDITARSLTLEAGVMSGVGLGLRTDDSFNRRGQAGKAKDYRSMFGMNRNQALDNGGFQNFNEFLNVFHSGRSDERLKMDTRAMNEGVPSSGGCIVPEQYAAWWLDASLESEIIRPRASAYAMLSHKIHIPGWDMGDHSSSVYGGLTGQWMAEGATASEVYAKVRKILMEAKKLACYTSASNELVADGISFEAQLESALIKAIAFYLDYAFIQGSGAGQPLGILHDPALITVARENGQANKTVLYENCVKMFARLAPQCMSNAIWIANQTLIPQLMTLSVAIGTGGAFVPAVQQANGKFYLLTKEIIFTEKCPALGAKGDLILCDPSQYAIGLRKEVSLDKSNAPGWTRDETSYRAILRADGQGTWDKAITPVNGDSLSWCVALAARS